MKKLLLFLVLLLFSACAGRDYHIAMLKESVSSTKQAYHIRAIRSYDSRNKVSSNQQLANQDTCVVYPRSLGSFSTGCN